MIICIYDYFHVKKCMKCMRLVHKLAFIKVLLYSIKLYYSREFLKVVKLGEILDYESFKPLFLSHISTEIMPYINFFFPGLIELAKSFA